MSLSADMPTPAAILGGLHILVVEDEMILAMLLEDMLTEIACKVVKAARIEKAIALIERLPIDGAILDINIAGDAVYPVARELAKRSIPFVFSSGYDGRELPPEFAGRLKVSKPFRQADLMAMLAQAIQRKH